MSSLIRLSYETVLSNSTLKIQSPPQMQLLSFRNVIFISDRILYEALQCIQIIYRTQKGQEHAQTPSLNF